MTRYMALLGALVPLLWILAVRDVWAAESEEQAVAAIEKLGGTIKWKDQPGKPVATVSLGGTKVTDADLAHFKVLTNLLLLDLVDTKVTDAGLAHLKGLINLNHLYLKGTKVTNAGLAHLKGLNELRWLSLDDTTVTDTGLARLKGLKKLRWLGLTGTKVTNAGVKELQKALPKTEIVKEQ